MDTRKAVKTYHRNLAIVLAIIVAIFAAIPLVVDKPYIINIFVLTFYMSTLSMAWNILGGITGQNSLGLAAYMGLGAYVCCLVQQGALLAKGRLMGLQFDVLFTDDLYTRISRNAIETADRLKEGLAAKGYRFYMESPTNQVFPILENSQLEALEPLAKFGFWEKYDDTHTVMRIATSWATRMEEIEQLIDLM